MTRSAKYFVPSAEAKVHLQNDGQLEIFFLGVGSAFSATMHQSNILIVKGASHLMIDLGSRASIALRESGISVLDLENLLVTHSHADHIGGIEEWCLKARYAAPMLKGCARGEYRPRLYTTTDYAHLLWDASLRGGLEFSEETRAGRRLSFSDYVTLCFGEYLTGYGRPVHQFQIGGPESIDVKVMRTNHVPDSSMGWQTAFYSIGILIDDRVFISGDTMFDRELIDIFGSSAELIFHDCQDFLGGVHASYEELKTLNTNLKEKIFLYHLPDGIFQTFKPADDGFAGWTRPCREGSYVFT